MNGVGINTEEPQNCGALELRSLGMGGVDDLKAYAPPHMLPYHVKFSSSATKGVHINRKEPQFGERSDPDPLE